MMELFETIFNNVLNTLIRDLSQTMRNFIAVILLVVGLLSIAYAISNKSGKDTINVGWAVVSVISFGLMVAYLLV